MNQADRGQHRFGEVQVKKPAHGGEQRIDQGRGEALGAKQAGDMNVGAGRGPRGARAEWRRSRIPPGRASPKAITSAVQAMFTDPDHLRVSDPGRVEGNVVFTYLDAFDDRPDELQDLKARYRRGGLGDMVLKRRLEARLQTLLAPIRERRAEFARQPGFVMDVVRAGTKLASARTQETLQDVKAALGMFRLNCW